MMSQPEEMEAGLSQAVEILRQQGRAATAGIIERLAAENARLTRELDEAVRRMKESQAFMRRDIDEVRASLSSARRQIERAFSERDAAIEREEHALNLADDLRRDLSGDRERLGMQVESATKGASRLAEELEAAKKRSDEWQGRCVMVDKKRAAENARWAKAWDELKAEVNDAGGSLRAMGLSRDAQVMTETIVETMVNLDPRTAPNSPAST